MSDTPISNTLKLPDIPSTYERFIVLIVFSLTALYMAYKGNDQAATLAGVNLATYFLSRQGV
jgi:hypothetical protein